MNSGPSRLRVFAVAGLFLAVAGLSGSCGSRRGSPPEPADLVLRGGRIVTLDENAPEVEALAARNGRIVAIGTQAEIVPYLGPSTQVIDGIPRRSIADDLQPALRVHADACRGVGAVRALRDESELPMRRALSGFT